MWTVRAKGLLGALLGRFLRVTVAEVEEWCNEPEQYYLLQGSLEARESVRVSGLMFSNIRTPSPSSPPSFSVWIVYKLALCMCSSALR